MKLAAISDIHGNLPALDAVLADIAEQRVDAIAPHHHAWLADLPSTLQLTERVFCCRGTLRVVAYDWEAAAQRAAQEGRPDWAAALRTGFVTRLESAG